MSANYKRKIQTMPSAAADNIQNCLHHRLHKLRDVGPRHRGVKS